MFFRKISEPDRPYFTVEVSNDYRIIQCHGYKNDKNGKPPEITEFEEQYQKYLEGLKNAGNDNQQRVQVCCGA